MTATATQPRLLTELEDNQLDAHIAALDSQIAAAQTELDDAIRARAMHQPGSLSPEQLRQKLHSLRSAAWKALEEKHRRAI